MRKNEKEKAVSRTSSTPTTPGATLLRLLPESDVGGGDRNRVPPIPFQIYAATFQVLGGSSRSPGCTPGVCLDLASGSGIT